MMSHTISRTLIVVAMVLLSAGSVSAGADEADEQILAPKSGGSGTLTVPANPLDKQNWLQAEPMPQFDETATVMRYLDDRYGADRIEGLRVSEPWWGIWQVFPRMQQPYVCAQYQIPDPDGSMVDIDHVYVMNRYGSVPPYVWRTISFVSDEWEDNCLEFYKAGASQ